MTGAKGRKDHGSQHHRGCEKGLLPREPWASEEAESRGVGGKGGRSDMLALWGVVPQFCVWGGQGGTSLLIQRGAVVLVSSCAIHTSRRSASAQFSRQSRFP